jgi:multidrug resistance efflux pump
MSTVSQPQAARSRPAPRLVLPPVPPAAPPRRARHWFRLSWLLGLALLLASLIGASHVLHSRPFETNGTPAKSAADRSASANTGVICHGTVAIDGVPPDGVALAPVQAGEVTEVLVYEGQRVHAGDILLRVYDEPFQSVVAQAEIGVGAAELQVAKTKRGLEQHRHGVDAQRAAVAAAQHRMAAGEANLHRARALKEAMQGNNDEIKAAEETLAAAKEGVKGEEEKLRALEAGKPEIELDEAQKGVANAKEKLRQARSALDNCVLKAPEDGIVLRLNVSKGSLISAQLRQAPVLFAPARPRVVRAEVEQEFAHRVQEGMPALVHDESNNGAAWQGTVRRLGDAYLPRRGAAEGLSLAPEARLLECVVELDPAQAPPRLGQRVRVSIGTQRSP